MTTFQAAVLSCCILALAFLYLALSPTAGLPMALLPAIMFAFTFSAILEILPPGTSALSRSCEKLSAAGTAASAQAVKRKEAA